MTDKELIDAIQTEVDKFVNLLGTDSITNCELSLGDNGEKMMTITFEGEQVGYLIGAKGRHLAALQFILSQMLNKALVEKLDGRLHVIVDVGGYRKKRQDQLEKLALRKADDARILGEPIDLSPMPASERRIVHMVLKQFDDLKTESYGEDPERYIRIIPTSEKELEGFKLRDQDEEDNLENEQTE